MKKNIMANGEQEQIGCTEKYHLREGMKLTLTQSAAVRNNFSQVTEQFAKYKMF